MGEKNINQTEIEKDLKQKLEEMGYSKKAIHEIFKLFSTKQQNVQLKNNSNVESKTVLDN